MEERQILGPDELGWELVSKDGKLYEKKTLVYDNGTSIIYVPLPTQKKKTKNTKSAISHKGPTCFLNL